MIDYNGPKLLLIVIALFLLTVTLRAEVPGTMSYQGRLTDDAGNPETDDLYNVTFKIYDGSGTMRWEESQQITTIGGIFSVQLGSNGSPLTPDVFDYSECWLGITIGADPEITPRTRLNAVPYAFRVGDVQSNDISNEPGVAAYSGAFYVYLDDQAYTTLCSLTITCPDEGYVMAVAHGRIATLPQHTMGTKSYAYVGISDDPSYVPGNQDLDFQIDSGAPSGVYSVPFGMTSMFTIPSAGSYTYYYLAYEQSGSVSVADMQFNLVYFPTAYGTVDPVPPPVKSSEVDGPIWMDESIHETVSDGKEEPSVTDINELRHELSELKARIEALQMHIDSFGSDR